MKKNTICISKKIVFMVPVILALIAIIFFTSYLNKQNYSTRSKASGQTPGFTCTFGGTTFTTSPQTIAGDSYYISASNGCFIKGKANNGYFCPAGTGGQVQALIQDDATCPVGASSVQGNASVQSTAPVAQSAQTSAAATAANTGGKTTVPATDAKKDIAQTPAITCTSGGYDFSTAIINHLGAILDKNGCEILNDKYNGFGCNKDGTMTSDNVQCQGIQEENAECSVYDQIDTCNNHHQKCAWVNCGNANNGFCISNRNVDQNVQYKMCKTSRDAYMRASGAVCNSITSEGECTTSETSRFCDWHDSCKKCTPKGTSESLACKGTCLFEGDLYSENSVVNIGSTGYATRFDSASGCIKGSFNSDTPQNIGIVCTATTEWKAAENTALCPVPSGSWKWKNGEWVEQP